MQAWATASTSSQASSVYPLTSASLMRGSCREAAFAKAPRTNLRASVITSAQASNTQTHTRQQPVEKQSIIDGQE